MSALANLKKTLSPLQQGLEQHRAALCSEFKTRHDHYMTLSGEMRALQESPPCAAEVENLLSEYLEAFLDKARQEFSRMTAPWRYASDCQEGMRDGRKVALQMLRDDPTLSALVMVATPALRAAIPAASRSLGWEFGLEPAQRDAALADLQAQLAVVTSEMDLVRELAESVGLRNEELPR